MRVVVATIALALAGAGCGSSQEEPAAAGSSGQTVEMQDNYFQPKTVTGDPGEKVTLTLHNAGMAEHTFTIKGGVDREVEPGASATVTVTLPKSGSTTFVCRYHEKAGMTGTLGDGGAAPANDTQGY